MTVVIQKRSQRVKSHKLNIRKYCTEDFHIPSKGDSTRYAEVVTLRLHHPHSVLLPHLPTSLKKAAIRQVLLIEISLNLLSAIYEEYLYFKFCEALKVFYIVLILVATF